VKTLITIENGKISVQVDDNSPVDVQTSPLRYRDQYGVVAEFPLPTVADTTIKPRPSVMDPPTTESVSQSVTKKSRARGKAKTPKAAELVARDCVQCGDDISKLDKRRKLCLKPECQKEYNRQYAKKWNEAHYVPKTSVKAKNGPVVVTKPKARQETSPTPVTPQFMPGHEKSPEEIEAWRPKSSNLPESMPAHGSLHKQQTASTFDDVWNCAACRSDEKLCNLHQRMTDDGSVPPVKSAGQPPQVFN